MLDPMEILTVDDVAKYLRVEKSDVLKLIVKGDIPSFDVGGQPRVQAGVLVQWFQHQMQMQDLKALKIRLENPAEWAAALDDTPEFRARLLEEEHDKGTMGEFLQNAAQLTEEEQNQLDSSYYSDLIEEADLPPPRNAAQNDVRSDLLARLKRHPTIAVIATIGAIVIAAGAFTDALSKILEFIVRFTG